MRVQVVLSVFVGGGGWDSLSLSPVSPVCVSCAVIWINLISSSKWRDIWTPPPPPPVVFWLTDLSCCCSMHHLLAESQMRLDEVLHIEIILVWHSFFFFLSLHGFFVFETEGISWTKGCRTSEGEVFADWSCMISIWMEMRDRHQCKTSALWQKHSQLLFMWPAEREEWFSVRFNFRSLKKHLQRTELLCGLLFPLQSLQKLLPAHHITSVKKLERRL